MPRGLWEQFFAVSGVKVDSGPAYGLRRHRVPTHRAAANAMAQVPKSAMCRYCVSRAMGCWRMCVVLAENRPVAGEQPLDIVLEDALQRVEERRDVAAVMGVDGADAAIAVNVVAAKQQVAQVEAESCLRCGPGVCQTFEPQVADR